MIRRERKRSTVHSDLEVGKAGVDEGGAAASESTGLVIEKSLSCGQRDGERIEIEGSHVGNLVLGKENKILGLESKGIW